MKCGDAQCLVSPLALPGFDALLWIVPIAAALIVLAVFVWRRWSVAAAQKSIKASRFCVSLSEFPGEMVASE